MQIHGRLERERSDALQASGEHERRLPPNLCLDGVFIEDEAGTLRFVTSPPSQRDVEATLLDACERIVRLLQREGLMPDDAPDDPSPRPFASPRTPPLTHRRHPSRAQLRWGGAWGVLIVARGGGLSTGDVLDAGEVRDAREEASRPGSLTLRQHHCRALFEFSTANDDQIDNAAVPTAPLRPPGLTLARFMRRCGRPAGRSPC